MNKHKITLSHEELDTIIDCLEFGRRDEENSIVGFDPSEEDAEDKRIEVESIEAKYGRLTNRLKKILEKHSIKGSEG